MKRMSIVLLVVLCTGCMYRHRFPIYEDYQRIKVGFPVPTDIQRNEKWGGQYDPNASKAYGIDESAKYQLANDGNVVAKWYETACQEVPWPLMIRFRGWMEGELLLNLDSALEYTDSDIRNEIEKKYIELWGKTAPMDILTELLNLAMDKGGLANEKFHLRKFKIDKFFPAMECRTWRISRTSSGSYYFFMAQRHDISPLVTLREELYRLFH